MTNIFEILKSKYNIEQEMNKIIDLYNQVSIWVSNYSGNRRYSIEELFDSKILPNWKQRGSYLACSEIRETLGLVSHYKNNTSIENIIIALEYFDNILYLIHKKLYGDDCYEFPNKYILMLQNITILIEHLNYERKIFKDEEKVILLPRKPEATAVAEISSEETALAILMGH